MDDLNSPFENPITKVKNLTLQEIAKIKQIEIECGLSGWTATDYENEVGRLQSLVFVSRLNDEIEAFLIARFNRSGLGGEADLLNFGVSPSFQRIGIGGSLFEALVEELSDENIRTLWLEVRQSNEKAVEFYLKRKFEITQIRKHFYNNPVEDALILKFEIDKWKRY